VPLNDSNGNIFITKILCFFKARIRYCKSNKYRLSACTYFDDTYDTYIYIIVKSHSYEHLRKSCKEKTYSKSSLHTFHWYTSSFRRENESKRDGMRFSFHTHTHTHTHTPREREEHTHNV